MFSFELLQEVAEHDWIQTIQSGTHGGEESLPPLLEFVRSVFDHVAPERLTGGLTLLASSNFPDALGDADHTLAQLAELADLPFLHPQHLVLVAREQGDYLVWNTQPDDAVLTAHTLVYRFDGSDHFMLPDLTVSLPEIPGFGSIFSIPTFMTLDEALLDYERTHVRHSGCPLLAANWDDDDRIVLANKPESSMRRSLEQYLRAALRGYGLIELRPEQNVDESHPIDIKVTWSVTNRIALIEIKWIGQSINPEKTATTNWKDPRANSGAKQLSDYLDSNKEYTPSHHVVGYLVVFDARRAGASAENRELSDEEALQYLAVEINYEPKYEELRPDFAPPVRLFMRPKTQVA